jgi:hypothetical protein
MSYDEDAIEYLLDQVRGVMAFTSCKQVAILGYDTRNVAVMEDRMVTGTSIYRSGGKEGRSCVCN